jgi:hypothetical protein
MPPTPAQHAQAVDHRCVAVGAHQTVGQGDDLAVLLPRLYDSSQVFKVDLMNDTGSRRHNAEILESALAPAQKLVALSVALVLAFGVANEGVGRAKRIYLYGVVYDQVYRHHGVDALRVATHSFRGRAEGGQIYH